MSQQTIVRCRALADFKEDEPGLYDVKFDCVGEAPGPFDTDAQDAKRFRPVTAQQAVSKGGTGVFHYTLKGGVG